MWHCFLLWNVLAVLVGSIHSWDQCTDDAPRQKCKASDFGFPECVGTGSGVPTSGLASSRRHPGRLYSVNDDGNSTIITVLDASTGQVVGQLDISNAVNVDWEDLAVGVCQDNTSLTCIYILDAGDDTIPPANCIYVIEEPEVVTGDQEIDYDMKIDFSGWGEDEDDCCTETLFIDPEGNLFFFSREYQGKDVALFKLVNDGGWTAVKQCVLTLPSSNTGPDGADLSPDGQELLIMFHDVVYHVCIMNGNIKDALTELCPVPYVPDPCGTSIAWASDGSGYYTSNESPDPPLLFSDALALRQCSKRGIPGPKFDFGQVLGIVNNENLTDVTGMAFSRDHPNYIYLINGGSTNDTCIYVIQTSNAYFVSTICLTGVENIDWQDMAVGPLVLGGPNCIFILDGGSENGGPANRIIMVPEPSNILVDHVIDIDESGIIMYNGSIGEAHGIAATLKGEICIMSYVENQGDIVTLNFLLNSGGSVRDFLQVASFAHQSGYPGPESFDIASDGSFILVKNLDSVWIYPIVNEDFALTFLNTLPIRAPYAGESLGLAATICPHSNSYYTVSSMQPNRLKGYRQIRDCHGSSFNYDCLL